MTPAGRVVAVSATHAVIPDVLGDLDSTGIDKRPLTGRVAVGALGVAGDVQVDTRHHGGVDQAVYAYAREDQQAWERELGRAVPAGSFGENLTTAGIDVTGALVGERWQVGDEVVVEVTAARIPCATFQGWMGEPHWVRRFTARRAPGAYLRVVRPGTVAADDPVEVQWRPDDHDVTVGDTLVVRRVEPGRLERVLRSRVVLHAGLRASMEKALGSGARTARR